MKTKYTLVRNRNKYLELLEKFTWTSEQEVKEKVWVAFTPSCSLKDRDASSHVSAPILVDLLPR